MGMFDELKFKPDLAIDIGVDHRDHWFQTKSLNCEMDYYEVREDGSLWIQTFDLEDRSDPNAVGLMRLAGSASRVNIGWKFCDDFTGEICFHTFRSDIGCAENNKHEDWIEFVAWFEDGMMKVIREN